MKKFLILLSFFLSINSSFSQKEGGELIDSLKSRLISSPEDTGRVRLLGKLSFQYYKIDTDSGVYYAEKAIALAETLHWGLGLAFANNYLGINYGVKGNYPKALEFFHKSLSKYSEIGDQQGVALLSNNLGNFYRILKKFDKAIEFLNKSVSINTSLNNRAELIKVYNNLGIVYSEISDFDKSNDFYYKGLKTAQDLNKMDIAAQLMINIAENKTITRDYCGAIELSLQAIRISQDLNIPYDLAAYKSYAGEVYLKMIDDSLTDAGNCAHHARDKHKNLLKAKEYLSQSIILLERINDLALLSHISLKLSDVYERLGDTKNALLYYKKYTANKDSVFSKDNSLKIADLERKQEVDLRDNQIIIQKLEIEKKNFQLVFQVVLSLLILVLISLFTYLFFRKRQREKERKAEAELIKAKEKAEESDRLKSAFLANMSHEIRTPMNGILGFAELLKTQKLSGEEQHEYLGIIEKSGARMLNIINEIVDISRIESGQMEVVVSEVDINEQIEFLELFFRPEAERKGLSLSIRTPLLKTEGIINTDHEKFYAILSNLVKNAIKYTRTGSIEFGYEKTEGYIEFFVKDTGIGIPADRQAAVFERFVQADISDKEAFQGAGLGLSIAKAYVEMLGGQIRVESGSDKGCTFYFTIPYHKAGEKKEGTGKKH